MCHRPDPDLLLRIEAALEQLPRRQQEVFRAHRLEGMSYEEIACRSGLTAPRVERLMARALLRIDRLLEGRKLSWRERWF